MRAALYFDLPQDAHDHALASNAGSLASALHDLASHLRRRRKYADLTAEALAEVEAAEAVLRESGALDLVGW